MRSTYDFVVIGAGSAGCVLAERLSQDPKVSVLLVESGPPDNSPLIAMPMGIGKLNAPGNPHYWEYDAALGGNRGPERWVKGRTLGGSSAINGMVYIRGAPADYDGWATLGCPGWGWSEIGRCFTEIEHHALGCAEWRGSGGPLRITMSPVGDEVSQAVLAAVQDTGTPLVADINDVRAVAEGGFGPQPATIWRGRRFSAARAFLTPARSRRNLDIVTDTDALGLLFDGGRASGVTLAHRGEERSVAATREVILSAGAINSPKLLQLSGIGPAALLQSLGIAVRVDAPAVGRDLQEHRTISVSFRLARGGLNASFAGPGLWLSLLRYALGRGPLTHSTFDLGGFVKTMPGLDRPDGQIGVGLFSFGATGLGPDPGMTIFGYFLRPESRGRVHITSKDPRAAPYIDANYLAEDVDRTHTIALYRYIRQIAAQPALAALITAETSPGPNFASDEELIDASFRFGTSGFHVSGTCRMGTDGDAPLDAQLRVKGVQGLRVVDTSIMPRLVSGNTNAPAMAIAWRAAEFIKNGD